VIIFYGKYNNKFRKTCFSKYSFVDGTSTGYEYVGWDLPSTTGWLTNFGYNSTYDWLFLPAKVADSGTALINDYYSQNTENRVYQLGGGRYDGLTTGLYFFNQSSTSSDVSSAFGSRLMFIP
jgi:hypothetical protein